MKVAVKYVKEAPRLTRLRYEPSQSKYILAYSDEDDPRFAEPSEVGCLADSAIKLEEAPEGALAAPLVAQIAVTRDCNLACKFCYAELSKHRQDRIMTTQEIKGIIDDFHDQGVIYLEWAGGEPLMRDDFVELMLYAYDRDFKQAVITNGTCFTDEFLKYAPTCMRSVQISIDDVGEHYNAIKGGQYWGTLQDNILRGLEAGLPAIASTVVTELNAPRVEEVIRFIWEIGFKHARICWQAPLGEAKEQSLLTYRELVSSMVKRVLPLQRKYLKRGLSILCVQEKNSVIDEFLPREYLLCSAGRTRLHIDWNGDAYACPLLKYDELKAGNILEDGLREVWFSPAFDGIRAVKNGETCDSCKLYCGYWCRAIVYGFTRDIAMNPSPICHHTWKEGRPVVAPPAVHQ